MVAFFYADNRLLASSLLYRLQVALDVFIDLFDRVGLQTNINKILGMVCHTCQMALRHSEAAYEGE